MLVGIANKLHDSSESSITWMYLTTECYNNFTIRPYFLGHRRREI